jgi:histone acetyltransferase (RNA polymerase elongator complex component)
MSTSRVLRFAHPEPPRSSILLLPFFLPFAGCPGRCVFCDQHAQTGVEKLDLNAALDALRVRLTEAPAPFGVGFFGGTFTGLEWAWQDRFLDAAAAFRAQGLHHVRVSTRPDRIDPDTLRRLRERGVDLVELGIQTFDSDVLRASGRGYDGRLAMDACRMARDADLDLGIQLLPGLPGHDPARWRRDVNAAIALRPAVVRIYPCVVMAGTELARMHARGDYEPWALDVAVREAGWAVSRFWEAGIRVIRLGLAGEAGMRAGLVAGPWHPAFGNMVRSEALCVFLEETLAGMPVRGFFMPRRLQGELWGHKRANAPRLERLGITNQTLRLWSEPVLGAAVEA